MRQVRTNACFGPSPQKLAQEERLMTHQDLDQATSREQGAGCCALARPAHATRSARTAHARPAVDARASVRVSVGERARNAGHRLHRAALSSPERARPGIVMRFAARAGLRSTSCGVLAIGQGRRCWCCLEVRYRVVFCTPLQVGKAPHTHVQLEPHSVTAILACDPEACRHGTGLFSCPSTGLSLTALRARYTQQRHYVLLRCVLAKGAWCCAASRLDPHRPGDRWPRTP